MRKIKWIVLLLVFSLIVPTQVLASTDNTSLPKPGILPGNLFYGLDSLIEKIHVGITFNPLMKADLLNNIAGERLAESEALLKKEDLELGQKTLTEYQDTMNQMLEIMSKEILKGTDITNTVDEIYSNSKEHATVLENFYDFFSPEQIDDIYKNLNAVEQIKNANNLFFADNETNLDENTLNALLSMADGNVTLSFDEIFSNDIYNQDAINAFYSLATYSGEDIVNVISKFFSNNPQYVEFLSDFSIDVPKVIRYANMDMDGMIKEAFDLLNSIVNVQELFDALEDYRSN